MGRARVVVVEAPEHYFVRVKCLLLLLWLPDDDNARRGLDHMVESSFRGRGAPNSKKFLSSVIRLSLGSKL